MDPASNPTYGTLCRHMLEGGVGIEHLGADYGAGLYDREVVYLISEEWAVTAEDILWRRTKLGLHLQQIDTAALQRRITQLTGACLTTAAQTADP